MCAAAAAAAAGARTVVEAAIKIFKDSFGEGAQLSVR
jgi:hypothetical protein